jgi:predicted RNA-binding Zn-ribbon protein involved in translation (DUF1610 family)
MKPTHWIETNGDKTPEFFCPVCGERLRLQGGGGPDPEDNSTDPPDTVTCPECGFTDHIEW